MRKIVVAALIGGLFAMPVAGAMAQDMASAPPNPKSHFLVFLDGGNRLSSSAFQTVSKAADELRDANTIRIAGHPAQVEVVKAELLKQGVPANAIMTLPERSSLKKPADGALDPAERYVEIKL